MKHKILVIGDNIIDHYVLGSINRQSPEDENVPVLDIEEEKFILGGAGNVAANIQSLTFNKRDFDVHFSSIFSKHTGELLQRSNIRADDSCIQNFLTDYNRPSCYELIKTRVIDKKSSKQLVRIDNLKRYRDLDISRYEQQFHSDLKQFDAIVISDYCKGLIDQTTIKRLNDFNGKIFVDTKKHDLSIWPKSNTYIKINSKEYSKSKNAKDIEYLIVTKGKNGAELRCADKSVKDFRISSNIKNPDVCGAGDVFLAGFVVSFMRNNDIYSAITFANNVACKSVQQKYTSKVFIHDF